MRFTLGFMLTPTPLAQPRMIYSKNLFLKIYSTGFSLCFCG
jgi:hypothetical protein